jgi:hypothetical protein
VASTNTVTFHETKRLHLDSIPEPPPALEGIAAELSGTVIGQSPNSSVQFVLSLQNNGLRSAEIQEPLRIFSLQFATIGNRLIPVPERFPAFLPKVGRPKDAPPDWKPDLPYPAPIRFRQIVRVNGPSSQKEETITIPPGSWIQVVFETEPVVMERVVKALRTETGERARSFKARATMALAAPPQPGVGGRVLISDWIFFTIPTLH